MSGLVVGILICLFVPFAFMFWAAARGYRSSVDMTLSETAKLPSGQRIWTRIIGFGGLPFMVLGAVAGILIRPTPNLFQSELIGLGLTGALWVLALCTIALRAPRKRGGTAASSPSGSQGLDTQ